MAYNPNIPYNDPAHQAELHRRFPRAGWWLGMLPNHPLYDPPPNNNQNAHLPLVPQAVPPFVPPPVYQPPPGPPPEYPAPQVAVPAPLSGPPTQISVSLPLNTAVVGGIVSHIHMRFPVDIGFADFVSRVCARMDLDTGDAELGYKFMGDLVRDPPSRLQTEEDVREMMRRGLEKIRRARTREVSIIIHNLRPARRLAAGASRKRTASAALDADEPDTTLTFVRELRELKRVLECQQHKGKHCYVSPINGEHQLCNSYKLSFWAKQIFLNQATYRSPPEQLQFDHVVKRARREKPPMQMGTAQPHIHVHIPNTLFAPPLAQQRRHLADRVLPQSPSHSLSPSRSSLPIIDLTTPNSSASVEVNTLDGVKCENLDSVKVKFEQENRLPWKF